MKTSSLKKAAAFNDKAITFIALSELYLPCGKSDVAYAAMCAFGTLRIICHSEERSDVRIPRKGHRIIKPTQDTFVLAWRKRRTQAKE